MVLHVFSGFLFVLLQICADAQALLFRAQQSLRGGHQVPAPWRLTQTPHCLYSH